MPRRDEFGSRARRIKRREPAIERRKRLLFSPFDGESVPFSSLDEPLDGLFSPFDALYSSFDGLYEPFDGVFAQFSPPSVLFREKECLKTGQASQYEVGRVAQSGATPLEDVRSRPFGSARSVRAGLPQRGSRHLAHPASH